LPTSASWSSANDSFWLTSRRNRRRENSAIIRPGLTGSTVRSSMCPSSGCISA
jgi:hypothetical protein